MANAINEAELLARLEGDEELLQELIDAFFAESGESLQQVLDAVSRTDAPGLDRAAHKLKGTVSLFGGEEATQSALVLETMGRTGNLDQAEASSRQLQGLMEALGKALAELREKHVQSSDRG